MGDGHVLAGDARRVGCGAGGPVVVPVLDAGRVGLPDGVQVVACRLHRVPADTVLAFAVCGAGTVLGGVPTHERVSVAGETIGVCGQLVTGVAGLRRRVAAGRAVAVIGEGLRDAGPAGVQGAGTLQRPLVARVDGLTPAIGLGVPTHERVSVAREPVLAYVDLLVGDPVLRVGLTTGRAVAVVGQAGLAGRPLRVQGQRPVGRPTGARRVLRAAPVRAGGPAGERVPVDRPAVPSDGGRVSGVAIPVGGALASRGLARGRVRIVADVGLVGRPLGDHGDDPVRLRGQVRDPLAVAVRLLVVGALPPGERVPVTREPVPVQVLADVVLERLVRGAAAGRPVAGESDCVPVADPVRVHGHVVGERRVEIVFVSAVRGRVPAVEPVAGNLARVAGRPTGFVGGGRVVGHGLRCGRAGRVAAGGRVHVVRQGGVDGPQCVYGLRPGGHDDLRPDVRVQRVPVHGVGDGHVPVVGVRVRAPPVERAVGLADLAGIPAVGVHLRGRQCDPSAGRIVDLAAGYGARRGDGLHAHGTVGSGDRPLAGPVILSGGRVGQHPAIVRDGSGFRSGALVGRGPDRAVHPGGGGFGFADLGTRGHLALAAVRVVAELVGEAEAQVVDDAVIGGGSKSTVLGDAPVGDHRAGLSGWDNDRALVGFPVVGMVPRFVAAFRGVHGIGVRVGDGSHIAGLVPVLLAGLGDRGAGQFDWGEMILVGAGEQGHAARVAFGAAGVADAERVAGAGRRVHGLGDGTARVHVGGRVPVLLAMQFEVLVAADGIEILPGERGGGQAAGLHARLSGHGLRVGADRALIGLHIHPGQALPLLGDRPLRGVEPAVHGQLVARGPGGDGLHLGVRSLERGRLRGIRLRIGGHLALVVLLQIMHRQAGSGFVGRESDTARGLGLGGLYGVLLAVLIGWHAAGRVRRILVVRELVRLVEA